MFANDVPGASASSEEPTESNANPTDLNTLHTFMFPRRLARSVTTLKSEDLLNRGNRQAVVGNEQLAISLSGFALRTIRKTQTVDFEITEDRSDLRLVIE